MPHEKACTACGSTFILPSPTSHTARCLPCRMEYKRAYYDAHPEKKRAEAARYIQKHRARRNAYDRDTYAANPEPKRTRAAAYKREHPEVRRASNAKRRASKRQATPTWYEHAAITRFYADCCPGYHVDHIVPLTSPLVCGLHCLANLQYLPASENCSKGNQHWPDMWEPE